MKDTSLRTGIFVVLIVLLAHTAVCAQGSVAGPDRTLSPYFLVIGGETEADPLPLKSTDVEADISGVIADVRVRQVYENSGSVPIEAVYVFPASTRAAVYGLTMTIGERTVTAHIRTRENARIEYEQAKEQGKSATLLEQNRPNVFTMNVANILPGGVISVELSYTELFIPMNAVYEFVYPTVVGPRYSNMSAEDAPQSEQWIANPYLHEGEEPPYAFDIRVNLSAGLPIADISCETHKTVISYRGRTSASVRLDEGEHAGGNRDFICRYRLAGKAIDTGLLLYEGAYENFFLMMVQPPQKILQEEIPPREYIFVVDVSGSMHGFPLDVSKKLLGDLIGGLRSSDRFNVLLFAGGSKVLSEKSLPATKENIEYALGVIDRERGGGGTELLPALKRAFALPGARGYSRSIIIATDGYIRVEKEVFDLIRNSLGEGNVFAFGIGSSVNRYLMEGMARAGCGEPFFVAEEKEALAVADNFRKLLASPVLTDISVHFSGFQAYDVEPQSIPDVFADRPLIVYGKWRGQQAGTIHVEGLAGKRLFVRDIDVSSSDPDEEHAALRYLWARSRIASLADYNALGNSDETVCEIRCLGLMYNLLTDYTSFVAVDTMVRLEDGKAVTIRQPLPLPQGVSDYAVGAAGSFTKMSSRAMPALKVHKEMALCEEVADELKGGQAAALPHEQSVPPHRIHIELKELTVPGSLDRDTVMNILRENLSFLEQCTVERKVRETEVACTLVIGPQGRVKDVRTKTLATISEHLFDCLMSRCRILYFPSSSDGNDVVVTAVFSIS